MAAKDTLEEVVSDKEVIGFPYKAVSLSLSRSRAQELVSCFSHKADIESSGMDGVSTTLRVSQGKDRARRFFAVTISRHLPLSQDRARRRVVDSSEVDGARPAVSSSIETASPKHGGGQGRETQLQLVAQLEPKGARGCG